ncbi:alkaline phosphatase family protein [Calidifontibacter sp. DB0510]|uniref:Alkaline phosphatase family protein n=1 Tax=Metallococcus carri TaxID=1656884 RepID=A0A967B0R7_9MICO|nr:alkaline phosphatase D family protein [Metallococcus carri]NHN55914.1 alkaline phosphatase family protein [Metallococcus carri]NOP38398.1 alkaline phosphatase family protein [Calidifontibacter sp. DB2511S]
MAPALVLGPLLRHVGETTATIFVQTDGFATVTVETAGRQWAMPTFSAYGQHYAIVLIDGLQPGSVQPYTVALDGQQVWPESDSAFPPSKIATLDRSKPARFLFGSCRTSVSHDKEGNKKHGVDALRAYAYDMAKDPSHWPDFVLFLGDQIYADETSPAMREFIERRRGLDEPPGEEVKDFVEYAELYRLAWSDPANRWLLSTLSSAMIFDDHDVRDDWNTSHSWHVEMNKKPWWHDRIVGALASYWVYQHAGNLDHESLRADPIWQVIARHTGPEELDLTALLHDFAERVDRDPKTYRFSFTRDLGESKLIVIDSRAARDLRPEHRAMLDEDELAWLDREMVGGEEHLFIGTSLPFLLPTGIHDLESLNETMAQGDRPRLAKYGEQIRQAVDLEHWAAFESSFKAVSKMLMEVASGKRGKAPATISFLSGDVHNSYINEVTETSQPVESMIIQAVCSPIRNPLPPHVRMLQGTLSGWMGGPMRRLVKRVSGVKVPDYQWKTTHGPWFDNNLASVEVLGSRLLFTWDRGEVHDGKYDDPQLVRVATVLMD